MTEVVKEFPTTDGLGAMLWKKVYAMSFAYHNKLLFEDTTLQWFLVHESDKVKTTEEYLATLKQFNNLLYNPWAKIDFNSIPDKVINTSVGLGLSQISIENTPGAAGFNLLLNKGFLKEAPIFNKIENDNTNNLVIHIRRGNAVPENPRYTQDNFYLNILNQIGCIEDKLKIKKLKVIICTDAPDTAITYKPDDIISNSLDIKNTPHIQGLKPGITSAIHSFNGKIGQRWMWGQRYLKEDAKGEFPLTTIDIDRYKKICPDITVYNKLTPYETILLMLKARVLIPAYASLSQCAGLLTHNFVIPLTYKPLTSTDYNIFKNETGKIDLQGNISL